MCLYFDSAIYTCSNLEKNMNRTQEGCKEFARMSLEENKYFLKDRKVKQSHLNQENKSKNQL